MHRPVRLEIATPDRVFDVDRFHVFYLEVIEDGLLKAAGVEAKLRSNNSPEQSKRPLVACARCARIGELGDLWSG